MEKERVEKKEKRREENDKQKRGRGKERTRGRREEKRREKIKSYVVMAKVLQMLWKRGNRRNINKRIKHEKKMK